MNTDERLDAIERRLGKLELLLAEMKGSNSMVVKLLKFVVLPLIVILGALVGVIII